MSIMDAIVLVLIGMGIGVYLYHRYSNKNNKTIYLNKKGLVLTKSLTKKVVSKRKTTLTKKKKAMVLLYKWGVQVESMPSYEDIQRVIYLDAEKELSHLNIVQADDLFIFFDKGKPVYTVDIDTKHVSDVNALREVAKKASPKKEAPKATPVQHDMFTPVRPLSKEGKGSEIEPPNNLPNDDSYYQ
jgi:hypothetical protein